MGEVFLARQAGIGGFARAVVLKKLLPQDDAADAESEEEALRRFLDEARVVAALSHENVVSVIEVGERDGAPFLALEYVHGENAGALRQRARKRSLFFPVVVAARLVADAARGLAHAHAARDVEGRPLAIVHRDVSPKNIFVRVDGTAKIGDFGIARSEHRLSRTMTGAVPGTLAYMAPEQAAGREATAASDQFSLGIVLWELLTGERLFRARTEQETLKRVAQLRVPRPSRLREDARPLDEVVRRMLQRDPAARFPSLTEVASAIEAVVPEARLELGQRAVAAFVEEVAGDELRERMKRIESGPDLTALVPRPAPAETTPFTPGTPVTGSHTVRADEEGIASTREDSPRARARLPMSSRRAPRLAAAVAAASLLVVCAAALGAWAMSRRAPSAEERTRRYLQEARSRHPFLHYDVFLGMASLQGADPAEAARAAPGLVALLEERLALLQAHWAQPEAARQTALPSLVARERALEARARELLRPFDEDLAIEALDMWDYDSSAPSSWAEPETVMAIQADLKDGGLEYMNSQADLRRIAVAGMMQRACADPTATERALAPLVAEREAVMTRFAAAPARELPDLDERRDALESRGEAALRAACGAAAGSAIASVAFHWFPDPDEPEPLHNTSPSIREEREQGHLPSVH